MLKLSPPFCNSRRWLLHLPIVALLFSLLAIGCGVADNRNHISGKVTFKGQPVPAGRIYFDPDPSKKNDGPQGYADIQNGQYDTTQDGKGGPGGATIVRIQGRDAAGKALFLEHKVQVDLPSGATSKDFEVPESAAKGLVHDSGPPP
jgi:hypothetical protein